MCVTYSSGWGLAAGSPGACAGFLEGYTDGDGAYGHVVGCESGIGVLQPEVCESLRGAGHRSKLASRIASYSVHAAQRNEPRIIRRGESFGCQLGRAAVRGRVSSCARRRRSVFFHLG